MKLKTFLTVVLYDCEVNFIVQDYKNDYEEIHRFVARCDSELLKKYDEYWVTFIDMEENKVFIAEN